MITVFRLSDAVDKALMEEQCVFRKDRGRVDQILTLTMIIRSA